MREYSKVAPQFWTGETGKRIRSAGRDAQVIAAYLMTCPSANMLGLYYLPLPTLCHEVGISKEGALKALRRVSEARFAFYDDSSEHVFVPEMARWQVGKSLSPKDKQVKGIVRQLEALRKSPFFNQFLARYRDAFHLHNVRPSEGPSKPHRSQEQEQEQEQDLLREDSLRLALLSKNGDSENCGPQIAEVIARIKATDPERFARLDEWPGWIRKGHGYSDEVILATLVRFEFDDRADRKDNWWGWLRTMAQHVHVELAQGEAARHTAELNQFVRAK